MPATTECSELTTLPSLGTGTNGQFQSPPDGVSGGEHTYHTRVNGNDSPHAVTFKHTSMEGLGTLHSTHSGEEGGGGGGVVVLLIDSWEIPAAKGKCIL